MKALEGKTGSANHTWVVNSTVGDQVSSAYMKEPLHTYVLFNLHTYLCFGIVLVVEAVLACVFFCICKQDTVHASIFLHKEKKRFCAYF